ncbi:pyridine nucleotide-disulfide oxidoreductase [Prauserella marina]|uniref:NADH dehydrogenase, FAD-containing subunit n=1 Tax=Prauserella marina TaxID=530584 RepID=A0A222VP42_9PSEU|nr:FAD-dependent oxidoreductase [Prauserella marina]ASR35622.1 pyridine nucleotide-disulfide oxidoreductase [Prauserella marina]PWV84515.1 NADH dehydrogenase FAD-containing subunit [Prauserella marina]SDC20441.1 NADH dehydrogenase, FAD-containing subunit [Prauserella marina]
MKGTVAVIGGGYGGAAAAKALDEHAHVVLIDPKDTFVHSAGSLRALVEPRWADNIFLPYDTLLANGTVIHDRAARVDPGGVTLASGERVEADFLVVATGSSYPFPAKMDTDVAGDALARLRATHAELATADRVLLVGAGPVGLELAGEVKAVWPGKSVTIVDPATELLPGFLPELREELERQLAGLGIDLRMGTKLLERPSVPPATAKTFAAATSEGELWADIWFRCHGVRPNNDFLGGQLAAARTPQGQLAVTGTLNVTGFGNVYALGDITDVAEPKMAAGAMAHAEVIAENIAATIHGERPRAHYRPDETRSILLPLGPHGGVGQIPSENGAALLPAETVREYKGKDLLVDRFRELFGVS